MSFGKQDLYTFAIGLAVAVIITLGESLATLDAEAGFEFAGWARNLLIGIGSATGRYILTELSQRGWTHRGPKE